MQPSLATLNYSATYKNSKSVSDIALDILYLILFVTFFLKSGILRGEFNDPFWNTLLIMPLMLWIYSIVKFFLEKTSYYVDNEMITVKKGIFFISENFYELGQVEELEVETVKIKYFIDGIKETKNKIVTFFYGEKEIALGFDLKGFDAEALAQAIHTAATVRKLRQT